MAELNKFGVTGLLHLYKRTWSFDIADFLFHKLKYFQKYVFLDKRKRVIYIYIYIYIFIYIDIKNDDK